MKAKKCFFVSGLFFVLFAVFTALVLTVDVTPSGPEGSLIGFSTINTAFFGIFGKNDFLYKLTEITGYIAEASACIFALYGVCQLIHRKSIKKIDKTLIVLGIYYVIVLAFYVLFEKVVINYRPVIFDEGLEASYPSSHTLLALSIMIPEMMQISHIFKGKKIVITVLYIICILITATTVIGRLFSGVHWLTDITGGIILSVSLICLYAGAVSCVSRLETDKN